MSDEEEYLTAEGLEDFRAEVLARRGKVFVPSPALNGHYVEIEKSAFGAAIDRCREDIDQGMSVPMFDYTFDEVDDIYLEIPATGSMRSAAEARLRAKWVRFGPEYLAIARKATS